MEKLPKQFLYDLGFVETTVVPYKKNNFEIKKVYNPDEVYLMLEDGEQWMAYCKDDLQSVFQVYSHYMLAKGHCICTGMGFLLRENWLLNKKDVTKITVIEKNKNVIDYHKKYNPEILKQIEVVHMDVYDYKGKCDSLLIDNFECGINYEYNFLSSSKYITDNIKSDVTWMWPLEFYLACHYRNYIGLSLSEIYYNIKKYFDIKTLPNLSEEQLFDFCFKFHRGDFGVCNFDMIKK